MESAGSFILPYASSPLYFAVDPVAGQPIPGIAYLPITLTTPSISLSQAWNDGGCFVFLNLPFWQVNVLAAALTQWLAAADQQGVGMAWIENPLSDPGVWRAITFKLGARTPSQATTTAAATISLRNVMLTVPQGSIVAPSTTASMIQLQSNRSPLTVTAAQTSIALADPVQIMLNDAACGGTVQATFTADTAALAGLDVGLRFFVDDPNRAGALISQRYPVFDASAAPLSLTAQVDPFAPLDATRTFVTFAPSTQPLASYYRTTLGQTIALTPQTDARLVPSVSPSSTTPSPQDALYFTPQGSFAITVVKPSAATAADQFLCGLSGSEYILLPQADQALLQFVPGQNAYAPGYPAPSGAATLRLDPAATTAWAYLLSGDLSYYAQPEGAELHQRLNQSAFFGAMAIPSSTLPLVAEPSGFPLAPYAGVTGDGAAYQQFEAQVLAPERRDLIYQLGRTSAQTMLQASGVGAATAPAPSTAGVTPQGFLATFSQDLQSWQTLTLARDSVGNQLSLSTIGDPLKAALQTNRQFLVISDPTTLSGHFPNNTVTIAGWTFDLDPATWSQHGTVLIIKFYANTAVQALVQDTTMWTDPAAFNTDPLAAQAALQSLIAATRCRFDPQQCTPPATGATNPNYAYFVQTVLDDPNWNGLLFLNSVVPLTGLPPQLEGLMVGIDPANLYAHHLGVTTTPTALGSSGALTMSASAFFGLISYVAPTLDASITDYHFQVLSLEVLIASSQVKTFASTINLTINQLFGEPVTLPTTGGAPSNTILLQGHYEDHDGHPIYSFTSTADAVFNLTSPIVSEVEVQQAKFATAVPPGGFVPGQLVASTFTLQGVLGFVAQPSMDLFGYDKLAFSNLAITMQFDPSQPQTSPQFLFDPSNLSFDPTTGVARVGSFVDQFPLQLTGFATSSAQKPTDLGYLSIDVPPALRGLGSLWYGLVFDLNLGTPGALASQKALHTTLLLAWSPHDPDATSNTPATLPATAALKLPSAPGSVAGFSLEDVIKLSLKSVRLYQQETAYILQLKQIVLKVVGVSLPPGGTTDIYIFGNPGAPAGSLAWYGAYAKALPKPSSS